MLHLLKEFEPSEIRRFANSAASISEIDPTFLGNLVDEFSIEMSKPELLRGGDQQVRSFLSEALPAETPEAFATYYQAALVRETELVGKLGLKLP